MATAMIEEDESTHCTVCLFPYDEQDRKPKFLWCYHTFCLHCMKSFARRQAKSIPCPTCRKETLCAVGKEASLTTNSYALKLLKLALKPSTQSLTIEDQWCFQCKKKATVSCLIGHSSIIVKMESKPISFFTDLHQLMGEEAADIDSTIVQWEKAEKIVKKVSETLKLKLSEMNTLDKKIRDNIRLLSVAKESANNGGRSSLINDYANHHIEGFTATSFSEEIRHKAANKKMLRQKEIESLKSSLPATKSIAVLQQILLLGFRVAEEELSNDQKEELKKLQVAASESTDDVVGNFGVAMTFYRNGSTSWLNNTEFGSVFIKPDRRVFNQLHLGAFGIFRNDRQDSVPVPTFGAQILASDASSFVLFGNVEPIMEKMFLDTEFLPSENSTDGLLSASEMEVKLVQFAQEDNAQSVNGLSLAFFLDRSTRVDSGILWSPSRSIPFGRIIQGSWVIELLSKLTPDEMRNVHVRVSYYQDHRECPSGVAEGGGRGRGRGMALLQQLQRLRSAPDGPGFNRHLD